MNFFDYVLSKGDAMRGAPPYMLNGQAISAPYGWEYPLPTYDAYPRQEAPASMLGARLTHDDWQIIIIGMFFLIALALVTRK